MRRLWILAAAVALGALPSAAMAQFIGTDGFYNATRTSGNTFNTIVGAPGSAVVTTTGDDLAFTVNFATPFNYYGTPFTSMSVSTNGLITFGGTNTAFTNTALTSTTPTLPSAAAYWDDLNFNVAGSVGQLVSLASGNTTTVEWNTVPYFGGTSATTATFQAVFDSATGNIRFNYGDISTGGQANAGSATVGIKGVATFIQAGFNQAGTVVSNDSILFTPVTVPEPGTMTLCGLAIAGGLAKYRRRKVA